ncbi:MAG TPA: DUF1801 domain-containing protein [Chitinophagaceae bacterium]|nr:DUF1801 domain-containing protein [Chitinophagaceae bacterium]
MPRKAPKNVSDYFRSIPPGSKTGMKKLRANIKKVFPEGEETISYQIPTIKYKGKMLMAYAAFTKHYSLFPVNKLIKKALSEELKKYRVKGFTLQVGFDQVLPASFLKKIIRIRKWEIDEKEMLKKR